MSAKRTDAETFEKAGWILDGEALDRLEQGGVPTPSTASGEQPSA